MTAPGRVLAVGLGPAGGDLVLPAARRALETTPVRFVRTARHPAVDDLAADGIDLDALDHLYEQAATIEAVYRAIADHVVAAAQIHGQVAYAVPGSPVVAERSVALLAEAAARGEIELQIVPGLSFVDLAWSHVGVDAVAGARVVDGRAFAIDAAGAAGPLLIAQVDDRFVCSDVKLALLDVVGPETPVTVLQRLGRPDEAVSVLALVDLDRVVEPDHLTAVFVDTGSATVAPEVAALVALAARLRGPGGCPWDAEQTHHSLRRFALEEAYEVVETIDALPPTAPQGLGPDDAVPEAYALLEDELGDLLFQVVLHSALATEAGAFTFADVARGIHDKLVRRHPHVFGDVQVDGSEDVLRNWELIKQDEKPSGSLVDGITPGLPALLYTHKLLRKADTVGLGGARMPESGERAGTGDEATEGLAGGLAVVGDALAALRRAPEGADAQRAIGELLAGAVVVARALDVDAESALRGWTAAFRDRFHATESLARDEGLELADLDAEARMAFWRRAETNVAVRPAGPEAP